MNTPLITIGITCYKAYDTIEQAIHSAIKQVWNNKEIIIVDDYSCDETINKLRQLQEAYPSLKVIYQNTNNGVAATRNKVIEQAKGEFIAFIDDDDQSDSNRLQKQYDRIVSYEVSYGKDCLVICHTARNQIYPNGTSRYEPTMGTNDGIAPNGEMVVQRILTGKPNPNTFGSMATCTQMARTSTYKKLNGFDENFRRVEDTDFNIRAAMAGAHFVGIADPLVTQTMTLSSEKMLAEERNHLLNLYIKHKQLIKNGTSYSFCRHWITAKYDFLQGKKFIFASKIIFLIITHPILTLRRMYWALPNTDFNLRVKQFHDEKI